jgi:hypothetical protein
VIDDNEGGRTMSKHRILALAAIALAVATAASGAFAFAHTTQSDLTAAKRATARFTNVANATAAGYAELRDAKHIACIAQPGAGGMGIHYVNLSLVKDPTIDPKRPEALVYWPSGKTLHLGAAEYIVFASAWKKSTPPELFGRTFDYVPAGNRYGLPAFWALHAWFWKLNPTGIVMAWNPRVSCR